MQTGDNVSKTTAYSVLAPPSGVSAAKALGYAVVSTEDITSTSKILAYAVLEEPPPVVLTVEDVAGLALASGKTLIDKLNAYVKRKPSRLSPYNITDDLLRSDLYREIRKGQTADNDWFPHEIQPDEALMPELIAYRRYQTADLKWLVLVAAKLDNLRERMEAGTVIKLPPVVWVRERIRYYSGDAT